MGKDHWVDQDVDGKIILEFTKRLFYRSSFMAAKRGHLRYKTRKNLEYSKIKYFEKSSVRNAMRKRANGENYRIDRRVELHQLYNSPDY